VQQKLQALIEADSESFQAIISDFPERFNAGVVKHKVDISEKQTFVEDICFHYCLSICSEEIAEVKRGIDILGLITILHGD